MARWITVEKPFEYRWPSRAVTVFRQRDMGEHLVKDELADHAVAIGAAREGKAAGSKTRSRKGNGAKAKRTRGKLSTADRRKAGTRASKRGMGSLDEPSVATIMEPASGVDGAGVADVAGADDRQPAKPSAE